jgi:phosphopantetheinyl transferase
MPLYKTITVTPTTRVLIWKIEEPFEVLSKNIMLTQNSKNRLASMKSDLHKRGYLSIRHLLAICGYSDFDLIYDKNGKPHLKDSKHISITHSFTYTAIIVSDLEVGIDIEKQREKIITIAPKFTPFEEYLSVKNKQDLIRKLTIVWCAKESLYKSFAIKGISFLQHIYVEDFDLNATKTTAHVKYLQKEQDYNINFIEFDGFTCAYVIIKLEDMM